MWSAVQVKRIEQGERALYAASDRLRAQRSAGVVDVVFIDADGIADRFAAKLIQEALFFDFPAAVFAEHHDDDFGDFALVVHADHESDRLGLPDLVHHNGVFLRLIRLCQQKKRASVLGELQISFMLELRAQRVVENMLGAANGGDVAENHVQRLRFGQIRFGRSWDSRAEHGGGGQPRAAIETSRHWDWEAWSIRTFRITHDGRMPEWF